MTVEGIDFGTRRVVGFLRYSVVTEAQVRQFKRTKGGTLQEAFARVFDDGRMAARAALFEAMTLPCFKFQAATGLPFELCILVSPTLPARWRERLEASVQGCSALRLVDVEPDEEIPAVTERLAYADLAPGIRHVTSFRIDDDDSVCDDYIETLHAATGPENAGKVHSFRQGYYGGLDTENRFFMFPRPNTNNAWGLSFIADATDGRSIFSLGRHSKIFNAAPMVINDRPSAWIRSVHDAGDRFTLPVETGNNWLRREDAERIAPGNFSFLDFGKVEAAYAVARATAGE